MFDLLGAVALAVYAFWRRGTPPSAADARARPRCCSSPACRRDVLAVDRVRGGFVLGRPARQPDVPARRDLRYRALAGAGVPGRVAAGVHVRDPGRGDDHVPGDGAARTARRRRAPSPPSAARSRCSWSAAWCGAPRSAATPARRRDRSPAPLARTPTPAAAAARAARPHACGGDPGGGSLPAIQTRLHARSEVRDREAATTGYSAPVPGTSKMLTSPCRRQPRRSSQLRGSQTTTPSWLSGTRNDASASGSFLMNDRSYCPAFGQSSEVQKSADRVRNAA